MSRQVVVRESTVPAAAEDVWQRAGTPAGINDELRPWLRMSTPRGAEGLDLTTISPPQHVGRSWIWLLGVLPVDFDDITVAEVGPGLRFLERSRMLSAPLWQHERTIEPLGPTRCQVRDELTFDPRPGAGWISRRLIGALFTHRHRRLVRRWSR